MDIKDLLGKTPNKILNKDDLRLEFHFTSGETYAFHHVQDCCECVMIDDICGDLADLEGAELVEAEEFVGNIDGRATLTTDLPKEYDESYTYTFYRFRTSKGSVVVRWLGQSNGYYSESVDHGWC